MHDQSARVTGPIGKLRWRCEDIQLLIGQSFVCFPLAYDYIHFLKSLIRFSSGKQTLKVCLIMLK
jgi:hypothetical protein